MPLEKSNLTIGDAVISGKGAKQAQLLDAGKALKWKPGPLRVQWQPNAFNDPEANRVSICFETTPAVDEYVKGLEDWVLRTLAAAPKKYFGQDLTQAQIQERYIPLIKTSAKGYVHLRAKFNLTGRNGVKCWDAETRAIRKQPEDWTMCEVQPVFEIKGLWIMARDFGLLVEMTDALISSESTVSCPF